MLLAVHCTDQLVQDFVSHVRRSPAGENTVIAVLSDHLLIFGDVEEQLKTRKRRLSFFLLDPDRAAQKRVHPATHFDVAPTLLDAVGMENTKFAFGHSLLYHEKGLVFDRNLSEADLQPFIVEALVDE